MNRSFEYCQKKKTYEETTITLNTFEYNEIGTVYEIEPHGLNGVTLTRSSLHYKLNNKKYRTSMEIQNEKMRIKKHIQKLKYKKYNRKQLSYA